LLVATVFDYIMRPLGLPEMLMRDLIEQRTRYFLEVTKAISAAGLSPGFARITHEEPDAFEITLSIPNSALKDYPSE